MSIQDKAKNYVDKLFGVSSKTSGLIDLPDDYSPVDEIADDDKEFNLVSMMSKAVDPQTGIPRNLRIPEGDFPEAKNYFDFCENFLGPDVRFPFTRQMWIAIHALGEYCVDGSTLLYTDKGLVTIAHMVGNNEGLEPLNPYKTVSQDKVRRATHGGLTGVSHTLKIQAKGELPVIATPEHRFYVLNPKTLTCEWKKAKDLALGDFLVSKVGTNLWPDIPPKLRTDWKPSNVNGFFPGSDFKHLQRVTPELARLTGYILADGGIGDTGIGFTNEDKRLLIDWVRCATSVFKLEFDVVAKLIRRVTEAKGTISLKLPTWTSDYLQSLGLCTGVAYTKKVPDYILQSTKEHVCHFLRAMFDCDGWIDTHKANTIRIGISMHSEDCVEKVHLFLKNLGVEGYFSAEDAPNTPTSLKYVSQNRKATWIACHDQAKNLFKKLIGSGHSKKRQVLETFVPRKAPIKRHRHTGKIPQGFVDWSQYEGLQDIVKARGSNTPTRYEPQGIEKHLKFRVFPKIINLNYFTIQCGNNKLGHFLRRTSERRELLSKLQDLKTSNFSFSQVTSVSKAGARRVYDITVPVGDSFSANGVIVHNCPRCSHPKWAEVLKIPIAFDARNLPNRVQFLHYGKCPKCKVTKRELIEKNELNLYTELALCVGQRAGKSTITASVSAYMLHKYLKYPKLSSVCEGIQASTPLTATFLGLRFADAFSLLWEPITNNIKESPWFQDFHLMLSDYGKRYGMEFYRQKDIYLKYMHKNLELYPAGPSKRALRGRTRWLSATDELGWWPLGEDNKDRERADGEEVYKAIDRSLLTVRREVRVLYKKGYSNFLMPLNINVSSPADQADMINKLVEKNKDSDRCLALRLPTWEVTPMFSRDNEEIVQAFKDDPVAAERDYGANPPLNSAKFIDKAQAIRTFTGTNRVIASPEKALINDEYRVYASIQSSTPPQPCPASVLSIDAGYSNNSFALTVLNLHQIKIGDSVSTTVKVPAIVEVQPNRGEKLHYTRIYKHVIQQLIKDYNVRYLFADRWNSIALLDRAADEFKGVELKALQYSVKYRDFLLLRSYLEESKIVLPSLEISEDKLMNIDKYPSYFAGSPAAHLLFQMLTVKDVGNTVVKGGNYTDDVFRALVLGLSRILDPKIQTELLKFSASTTRSKLIGAIAAGRSGMPSGFAHLLHNAGSRHSALSSHSAPNIDANGTLTFTVSNSPVVRVPRS